MNNQLREKIEKILDDFSTNNYLEIDTAVDELEKLFEEFIELAQQEKKPIHCEHDEFQRGYNFALDDLKTTFEIWKIKGSVAVEEKKS